MTNSEIVPLYKIPKGSRVIIVEVPEGKRKSQLIRLGIVKGEFIRCLERLPGGTVVIEKNRREIAIGTTLAKSISVKRVDGDAREGRPGKRHRYAFGRTR
jgi:ferrous iron transport protein A